MDHGVELGADDNGLTRRRFLKLGAYVAPVVICAAALPAQGIVFGDGGESSGDGGESSGGGSTGCESDGSESSGGDTCTVVIGGEDTGVPDVDLGDGSTLSEAIDSAYGDAENHGDFVSHVAELSNDLLRDGKISGEQHGAIMRAAARFNS